MQLTAAPAVQADELKQDLRDLDDELGKARIGLLQNPRIGDILERADRLEAAAGTDGLSQLPAPAVSALALPSGVMATGLPPLDEETAKSQLALAQERRAASSVGDTLDALKAESRTRAAQQLAADAPAADGGSEDYWDRMQLAAAQAAGDGRVELETQLELAYARAEATREQRLALYSAEAGPEFKRQVLLAGKRAEGTQQQLEEDVQSREQEQAAVEDLKVPSPLLRAPPQTRRPPRPAGADQGGGRLKRGGCSCGAIGRGAGAATVEVGAAGDGAQGAHRDQAAGHSAHELDERAGGGQACDWQLRAD